MAYGLIVRVHHTGKAADSVFLSDIDSAIDDQGSFRKAGGIYVPVGGFVDLVYTRIVSISFETGAIRQFENTGYVWTEFIIGSILGPAIFPEVQDEGITVDPATKLFDFVGAGVTASQTAPGEVRVNIPGGGGGDHAALINLGWLVCGHTGNPNTIAGFDGAGATRFYVIGTDIEAWDADLDALAALAGTGILVRSGPAAYSLRTIIGTPNHITVVNGDGVAGNPTLDVGANVILTTTPLGGDLSGFLPAPSVSDFSFPGQAQGDVLYFDGANWTLLSAGNAGEVLVTGGAGANPSWDTSGTSGAVVNGIRHYGKLATDPAVGPAPADGDTYYNTTLKMPMAYDGTRAKWLSVEAQEFTFGRNGNTAADQFYRTVDGRVMSGTLGWRVGRNGTVVDIQYTRRDADAATFEVMASGVQIGTLASAATNGGDVSFDADFNQNTVLAVKNQAGGNTTSDVVGWIKVKWRA